MIYLKWCSVAKTLSWTFVEFIKFLLAIGIGNVRNIFPLRWAMTTKHRRIWTSWMCKLFCGSSRVCGSVKLYRVQNERTVVRRNNLRRQSFFAFRLSVPVDAFRICFSGNKGSHFCSPLSSIRRNWTNWDVKSLVPKPAAGNISIWWDSLYSRLAGYKVIA